MWSEIKPRGVNKLGTGKVLRLCAGARSYALGFYSSKDICFNKRRLRGGNMPETSIVTDPLNLIRLTPA